MLSKFIGEIVLTMQAITINSYTFLQSLVRHLCQESVVFVTDFDAFCETVTHMWQRC